MRKYLELLILLALPVLCWAGTPVSAGAVATEDATASPASSSAVARGSANRLAGELSPYLLQHAYNPVNWYPWGEEAFARARQENKPIFLSIGYSTCHWCHVMAHESFENEAIAAFLNEHFISIKLDREERPDIDAVYMSATQLLNGQGGWPMTVFINHDFEPFYAGTYFPPETIDGHRGFRPLLIDIQRLWQDERQRVELVADNIANAITTAAAGVRTLETLDDKIDSRALKQIALSFDAEAGGFGNAPKFPRYAMLMFLATLSAHDNDDAVYAKDMLHTTLTRMAQGGIHDQVGGGFHRYAVDAEWQVPHFEKMLYSQALLALAYTRFYSVEPQPLYAQTARAALDFVLRDMTSAEGGFYSALDADSARPDRPGESSEGAYYLWSEAELRTLLSKAEFEFVQPYYDIERGGNIASDPYGEFNGLNILAMSDAFHDTTLTRDQQALLDSSRQKLLARRDTRPRPHLDDKIITAWNGMMISAFAEAASVFDEERYRDAAVAAAAFVRDRLFDSESGELRRRYRAGQAGVDAGLADYAWYVRGLLDVYRLTEHEQWLRLALELSRTQHALFADDRGGYYDTSDRDRSLLFRTRSALDGALPAATAVVLANYLELHAISKDKLWQQRADRLLENFAGSINSSPSAAAMMLYARLRQPF